MPLRSHGGGTDTEQGSAHKVNSGEENSTAAPAEIRTRNLSITSPAFYKQAILPYVYKAENDSIMGGKGGGRGRVSGFTCTFTCVRNLQTA